MPMIDGPAPVDIKTPRCLAGFDGCDCDDPYTFPLGSFGDGAMTLVPTHCECHDCYTCGEIECDGHQS